MTRPGDTLYADPAQFALVVARLPAGHSAIYAKGPVIDRGNATVCQVQALADAGTVTCHLLGRDGAGLLQHGVVKRALRQAQGDPSTGSGRADHDDRSARFKLQEAGLEGRVLREALALVDLIADHARKGLICPSSGDVAAALGLRDRKRADYLFDKLNQAKVIERWSRGRSGRVVALVGTRLRTSDPDALPVGREHDGLAREIAKVFK